MQMAARAWAMLVTVFVMNLCLINAASALDINAFVGTYEGSAELVDNDGNPLVRDMSVTISAEDRGFVVEWSTATIRDGRGAKIKSYAITFVPSDREDVFAAAMQRNVFGKEVPLDPMKGEPYVWARILGDTLSVFSLFVGADGGYEIQQFDRTLQEGGLQLEFQNVQDGQVSRRVSTFLERQ